MLSPEFDCLIIRCTINTSTTTLGAPTQPRSTAQAEYITSMMIHEVDLGKHLTDSTEIPPCAMYIGNPLTVAVMDVLLPICSEIWRHQAVTDLWMVSVTCNSSTLPAPRLTNPQCLYLNSCELPNDFVDTLLHQVFRYGESLQKLVLSVMNLDELLEDLVAYHQKALTQGKLWLKQNYTESDPAWGWMKENHLDELLQYILSLCYKKELHQKGLAQRKLQLELTGIMGWKLTNLSEEFEEKWRNRCQGIDSIDCRIESQNFSVSTG